MRPESLKQQVLSSLADVKALNVIVIDVRDKMVDVDFMIIATGSSGRHAAAVAQRVISDVKKRSIKPPAVEGMDSAEWILIDLGDVIVHVMQQETRDFYDLEQLWHTELTPNYKLGGEL